MTQRNAARHPHCRLDTIRLSEYMDRGFIERARNRARCRCCARNASVTKQRRPSTDYRARALCTPVTPVRPATVCLEPTCLRLQFALAVCCLFVLRALVRCDWLVCFLTRSVSFHRRHDFDGARTTQPRELTTIQRTEYTENRYSHDEMAIELGLAWKLARNPAQSCSVSV